VGLVTLLISYEVWCTVQAPVKHKPATVTVRNEYLEAYRAFLLFMLWNPMCGGGR